MNKIYCNLCGKEITRTIYNIQGYEDKNICTDCLRALREEGRNIKITSVLLKEQIIEDVPFSREFAKEEPNKNKIIATWNALDYAERHFSEERRKENKLKENNNE